MLQSAACRDTVSFFLVFMFMPAVPTAAAHCPYPCPFIEVATQVSPPRSRDHSAHSGLDEGDCECERGLSEYTLSVILLSSLASSRITGGWWKASYHLEVDHMGLVQVFCLVREAEVYSLIKRWKVDLALTLETKLGYMLHDLLSIEKNRSNNDMCGQRTRAYMTDDLKVRIIS